VSSHTIIFAKFKENQFSSYTDLQIAKYRLSPLTWHIALTTV